jgi:hypothetical protein
MALKAFFDNASSIVARLNTSQAQMLLNGFGISTETGLALVIALIEANLDTLPLIIFFPNKVINWFYCSHSCNAHGVSVYESILPKYQ